MFFYNTAEPEIFHRFKGVHGIFRTDGNVDHFILYESGASCMDNTVLRCQFDKIPVDAGDGSFYYIGLPDKSCHKFGFRVLIDLLSGADLLDDAAIHHGDPVAHGQSFLLIVSDIDKCDAKLSLQMLQFHLHLFTQFQIQRSQRFI